MEYGIGDEFLFPECGKIEEAKKWVRCLNHSAATTFNLSTGEVKSSYNGNNALHTSEQALFVYFMQLCNFQRADYEPYIFGSKEYSEGRWTRRPNTKIKGLGCKNSLEEGCHCWKHACKEWYLDHMERLEKERH